MPQVFVTAGNKRFAIVEVAKCGPAFLDHLRAVLAPTAFDAVVPIAGELAVDFLARKAEAALEAAVPLLAAMLLPAGRTEGDWSPAMARRTERFLQRFEGATERQNIRELARLCAVRLLDAALPRPPDGDATPPTIH